MSDTDPRETDYHPRLRTTLCGHEEVEHRLLVAYRSGRMHHAWLLTGPKGIGKATLAYRLARYILRYPDHTSAPEDMAVAPEHAVFRRVAARGHADLLTIERPFDEKLKRLKGEIGVTEARAVSQFFSRTA
ncbi:MAG: DNA polymerase III subunit delta', partial [Aestuariivirgaceae bacterium]